MLREAIDLTNSDIILIYNCMRVYVWVFACVRVRGTACYVRVCVFCVCIRICKIDINSDQMNIIYKDSILLDMYGRTIDIVRSVTKTELHEIQ